MSRRVFSTAAKLVNNCKFQNSLTHAPLISQPQPLTPFPSISVSQPLTPFPSISVSQPLTSKDLPSKKVSKPTAQAFEATTERDGYYMG